MMTAQDTLDGSMIVAVKLQLVRPGEFLVLSVTRPMSET